MIFFIIIKNYNYCTYAILSQHDNYIFKGDSIC
jgi:hypothetical protein